MNANPVNQNALGSMVVHVTGTDVTDALSCSELSPPSAVVDLGAPDQADRNRRGKILLSERSIQIQKRELDLTEVVVGLTFIDSDDACISEVEADINMNPVTVNGVVATRARAPCARAARARQWVARAARERQWVAWARRAWAARASWPPSRPSLVRTRNLFTVAVLSPVLSPSSFCAPSPCGALLPIELPTADAAIFDAGGCYTCRS